MAAKCCESSTTRNNTSRSRSSPVTSSCRGGRAEPRVARRLGPHSVVARHHAVEAAPAGELLRSAGRPNERGRKVAPLPPELDDDLSANIIREGAKGAPGSAGRV